MEETNKRNAAKNFADYWKDKGYEKGESQPYWLSLLRDVYGIESPEKFITFEEQVKMDNTSFIDGYIPSTHVLIEQKGIDKDLRKPIKQSDGSLLNPFQQAQRYSAGLPYSQRPRWIVTCNFESFLVYDMEKPNCDPEEILLENLPKEYYRLQFLVDTGDENIRQEMEVSIKAGDIVGLLYDAILKQYIDPENPKTLQSLNKLIVRLVFCLYAEDAGIFGGHNKFHNYINSVPAKDMRKALIELFRILDTKPQDRDPYEEEMLASFPYVNGGLFADENIEIPQMNDTIRDLLLRKASEDFDWSVISPTIFGAVFESTLNPDTRRKGGMHYTSIENIHKVIDPLFLDELRDELAEIKAIKISKTKEDKLNQFRNKLGNLTFLDPACGSGNFLTETYISLRRLENEALKEIIDLQKNQVTGQIIFNSGDITDPIKVTIKQFYGIEINDFAVSVAKTALWIAESQQMKETEEIIHTNLEFLPLKSYANIVEGNALRIDWESVVPKDKLNYIMGNPPFVGARQNKGEDIQKIDLKNIFSSTKKSGNLDYVACWYKKAVDLMYGTKINAALVSTNSITQGEQVSILWNELFKKNIHINFAYKTFRWDSEANLKAHVHCVIIGFCTYDNAKVKRLYDHNQMKIVNHINPYLLESEDIYVCSRTKPICQVPKMNYGNLCGNTDNFILTEQQKDEILSREPNLNRFIKQYVGADEYINGKTRYCFWLVEATPKDIAKSPELYKRVKEIKEYRSNPSKPEATRRKAETPHLFFSISQPESNFILIPRTSSENRKYIPFGFVPPEIIASDACEIIADATLYHFGVLISNVHMAWVRTVAGRLKSDYRYSKDIVYNNFPWPNSTNEQKKTIEQTAQAILDARALYQDCSLADLYGEVTMPVELRKAHQANDKAVMQAYGFWGKVKSESECVPELMRMYKELTE
ncbi:MAG: methylase [Oscillospiraceae bacterium]|nr:methylase [Oscillospiraceae bacterium]